MKNWIKAYWAYRLELDKERKVIKLEVEWFWPIFWLGMIALYVGDKLK